MNGPERLRVFHAALALALLASLAGCGGQVESPVSGLTPGGPPPGTSPSAIVFFCNSGDPACTPSTDFSVAALRDWLTLVEWRNYPVGYHLQTTKVFLPDGNLYQSFETPFEITQSNSGLFTTVQAFPVAGGYISQRSLTGDWRVEVLLDGEVVGSQVVRLDP